MKKRNKKNQIEIILKVISLLLIILFLASFSFFSYFLLKLNIIPTRYIVLGFVGVLVMFITSCYCMFSKVNKIMRGIAMVVLFLFSLFICFSNRYLVSTYDFFVNTSKDYNTISYSIVVLKDDSYSSLNELNGKIISYLSDNYVNKIKSYVENRISFEGNEFEDSSLLSDSLLNKETDAIVLEDSHLVLINEESEEFAEKTKVIETFEIQIDSYKEETSKINVEDDSFILYISGIDQYGKLTNVNGRSDVNQIAVVNPRTHHILLVNTPRDYYVQLAGTTGLKDKLTHAGIYGVEKSIKTLENFYEIDINHYLRVNFDTLIKVVDVIGGIDINSDLAFQPLHGKNYINKGINHFDGEMALAYARERYAYQTGDNHRGQNQQQVISAIIDKMTSSKVLISKYNDILKTLEGSFQTDMSMEFMTSFIKAQINDMPTWTVEGYAVSGTGSMNYTYSMGTKYNLYVMEPDYNSVNIAKEKIKEVFNEK